MRPVNPSLSPKNRKGHKIFNLLDEGVNADKALDLIGLLVVLHEPAGHEADVLPRFGPQSARVIYI